MSTPLGHDRQPRRGDVIEAAPLFPNGLSGTVVGVTQGRITFDSPVHGRLQLPLSRFCWKPKARVWTCYSQEVCKMLKTIEAGDEAVKMTRYGLTPCVGDCVSVDGKIGWIARKTVRSIEASASEGALFKASTSLEIALAGGNITVESDVVAFDSERRLWNTTRA